MADSNNVAAYTFSNVSNTQRENANTTITTENLYKSDELVDAVKNRRSTTLNIILQTQQSLVTYKVVLQAIQKQLLTLAI